MAKKVSILDVCVDTGYAYDILRITRLKTFN